LLNIFGQFLRILVGEDQVKHPQEGARPVQVPVQVLYSPFPPTSNNAPCRVGDNQVVFLQERGWRTVQDLYRNMYSI